MYDIINVILNSNSILLMTHNSPDGDGIGCLIALENILKQLNKEIFVVIQNKISKNYINIIGKERVNKIFLPNKKYDLIIILDCSDINRIYEKALYLAEKSIVIDHHIDSNNNTFNYIYKEIVCSTGIIIYKLIKELETKINKRLFTSFIATCLFLTIRSDTSNFQNNNTDALTFEISGALLKLGANIELVNKIFENRNFSLLKLMSNCFHRICIDYNYKLLYLIVKREDIIKSNSSYEEASSLINYIKNINEIDTYILFIEDNDNIKVRARSNTINVSNILNKFNGGGHKYAAGALIYGDNIYNISNKVINEIKNYKEI